MARKILLADDSVTAQNMGRRILIDAGYDVTTVNNGSAALKKIAESKPDLIVLDVYMPGYGGLEVCQRIRESQETARIPVLLTVGKLEPFKADEARRVRADAFIVKPFEASELLTALTKLEDKIVPQPAPHKPGRFARAMAAAEEDAHKSDFGDTETGWKNRLKIPPPHHPKSHDDASALPAASRGHASAILENITAEEIAAIEAAAAAFRVPHAGAVSGGNSVKPGAPATDAPTAKEDAEQTSKASPVDESSHHEAAVAEVASTPEPPRESTFEVQAPDRDNVQENEFAAALASLIPSNGDGAAPSTTEHEPTPVTIAAAVAQQEFTGPRWIAEPAQISAEESSQILEEEMNKALAAIAMMEATRAEEATPALASLATTAETAKVETASLAVEASAAEPPASEQAAVIEVVAAPEPVSAVAEVKEQAAYAAAASSGSDTSVSSSPAPVGAVSKEPEAELAAAWASWKQVRDSGPSPEPTAPSADAISSKANETPSAESINHETESAGAEAAEDSGIASIVDSVLAELKPKLMREIAKKMGKEKK